MAVSALLLLLPLLLGVHEIPEESVQSDANAVLSTILSLDKPRNVIDSPDAQLTVPQKALFKMHWELETVQSEKPGAPPQFDLALFAEALEAFVEMDEATKEVRLSKDKLNEWAGIEKEEEKEEPKIVVDEEAKGSEKAKATEEGTKEAETSGTVPEVRVNANGNFEVMNGGAGRDGKMEVRRQKDENGNEQVVVTFVKEDEAEGPAKGEEQTKPKERDNNDQQQQEQKPKDNLEERTKMENMANNASTVVPTAISPLSTEEDDDVGSFFNLLFGRRKKRQTVVRENVQRTEDGRTIRTTEKLTTLGKPGAGFTKVFNYTISMDKGGEQPQEYWPKSQNGTIESSESKSAGGQNGKDDDDDEQQQDEQEAEIKQCSKGEKEQYERKAEIKQYLDQGVTNAKGKMKNWEKLAYIWYSQLLYWTAKWIEVLEKRMAGVDTELAQDFLCSNTGLAAYNELNFEMKKYEVKLAKLKEWIGQYFK